MASLSERLKRERELRGISLKQISEETRIGVRFLEALEEDRIDLIPGEFYRRSYLRAYARYLGLDEDRALNAYDFSRKETGSAGEEDSPRREPRLPSWMKWILVSGAIALPAVLLLRAMPSTEMASHPEAAAPFEPSLPAASVPTEEPEPRAANPFPPVPETMVPSLSAAGTLRLVLSVEEECWLEIEADGDVVLSGLKEQGFRQEIEARQEIRMWVGNAGGVNLVLNDHPARTLGRPGQVLKDVTITPSNFREFVQESGNRS